MTSKILVTRLCNEAKRLEAKARALRKQANQIWLENSCKEKNIKDTLTYAANQRCRCGAGMAYDRNDDDADKWVCSRVLLGQVPNDRRLHDIFPFSKYKIQTEFTSKDGSTTRPHPLFNLI